MYKASYHDPPEELGKSTILLRSYIAGVGGKEKKKKDLYHGAGTSVFEELWLMCDADAPHTVGRRGGGPNKQQRESLCLIFSCPALKYKVI